MLLAVTFRIAYLAIDIKQIDIKQIQPAKCFSSGFASGNRQPASNHHKQGSLNCQSRVTKTLNQNFSEREEIPGTYQGCIPGSNSSTLRLCNAQIQAPLRKTRSLKSSSLAPKPWPSPFTAPSSSF
jgi:hypothetical protein